MNQLFRRQVQDPALLIHQLCELQRLADTTPLPVTHKGLDGLLMGTTEFPTVQLQGFLLGFLRRIAHIALTGFLDAEDISLRATLDEDLLKGRTPHLIVETVDGEDLLAVDIRQGQCGLDVIELILDRKSVV